MLFLVFLSHGYAELPAFPGAEGAGAFVTGGRGGKVFTVTNLNDSGSGSLRAAVEASGARTVVFRVSGNIQLTKALTIRNPNLTIAGQTAFGDGICIANYPVVINTSNVILRFLRVRMGDAARIESDALSIDTSNRQDILLDHCSVSWSVDECLSGYDGENVTVQYCLIAESLWDSVHSKGEHGYGGIWGGKAPNGATYHHNLLAHHTSRTPRFNGGRTDSRQELVDFRNNVIYNWGFNSAYGGEDNARINMVNNYYKFGPATQTNRRNRIVEPYDNTSQWYVTGNYVEGYPSISADNWSGGVQGSFANLPAIRAATEFAVPAVQTDTAEAAYAKVLRYVGACLPRRDLHDARIIEETRTGTARFGATYLGGGKGIINSQTEVGGWPDLLPSTFPADSDLDGIPDIWEKANGLNSANPLDGNFVHASGYTHLERYLHSLASLAMPEPWGVRTVLSITQESHGWSLRWPPEFAALRLQSSDSLDGAWTDLTPATGESALPIDPPGESAPSQFFRMAYP